MAKYDLSSRIGTCLDRHLVFPILEFLSERGVSVLNLIVVVVVIIIIIIIMIIIIIVIIIILIALR